MNNIVDSIVEAFEAEDFDINYRYGKNGDVIGISGKGISLNKRFPDLEIDIDLIDGGIDTYKDNNLFFHTNLRSYDKSIAMDQLMSDLNKNGFFDPIG